MSKVSLCIYPVFSPNHEMLYFNCSNNSEVGLTIFTFTDFKNETEEKNDFTKDT